MYTRPPLVAVGAGGALVVGTTTTVIIAAPGAGLRIRIVGGIISINRTATGIVDMVLAQTDGTDRWRASGLSIAGTPLVDVLIPEPGYQFPDNLGLQIEASSTAATGNAIYTIYYYLDEST